MERRTRAASDLKSPPESYFHKKESITWPKHAGKPRTNGNAENRHSAPGTGKVSTLLPPLTFSTDVTSIEQRIGEKET